MQAVVPGETGRYSWLALLRATLRGNNGDSWSWSVKVGSGSLLSGEEMQVEAGDSTEGLYYDLDSSFSLT